MVSLDSHRTTLFQRHFFSSFFLSRLSVCLQACQWTLPGNVSFRLKASIRIRPSPGAFSPFVAVVHCSREFIYQNNSSWAFRVCDVGMGLLVPVRIYSVAVSSVAKFQRRAENSFSHLASVWTRLFLHRSSHDQKWLVRICTPRARMITAPRHAQKKQASLRSRYFQQRRGWLAD